MKYSAHLYARALVEALSESEDEAAIGKNFLELVKKNSDEAHLKKILDEASRMARSKSGIRKVTIESARALNASQRSLMDQFVQARDIVEERVDPELIAGVKITVNDEMQFDGSLKYKLSRALGNS